MGHWSWGHWLQGVLLLRCHINNCSSTQLSNSLLQLLLVAKKADFAAGKSASNHVLCFTIFLTISELIDKRQCELTQGVLGTAS